MAFKLFKFKSKSAAKATAAAQAATATMRAPTAAQQEFTGSQTIPDMTNNNTSNSFDAGGQQTSSTAPQQVISGSQTIGTMTNNNVSGSYNNNHGSNHGNNTDAGEISMSGLGIPSNVPIPAGSPATVVQETPTAPQQVISGSQTIGTMKDNNVSGSYNNNYDSNNNNYDSNNDSTTVNGGITMTGFGMPSNIPMPAGSHATVLQGTITLQGPQSPAKIAQILEAAGVAAHAREQALALLEAIQSSPAFQQPPRVLQQN